MEKLIKNLTWMNLVNKLKVILTELSKGSGETNVSSDNITDATTLGKDLLKASNAASARTAIGAGTSNLTIGTTATTAKAGNYHPTWAQVTGKPTFENGLREEGGVIKLGGTRGSTEGYLTEETYLAYVNERFQTSTMIGIGQYSVALSASNLSQSTEIQVPSSGFTIINNNSNLGDSYIKFSTGAGFEIGDNQYLKGLRYKNDYSSKGKLDDRWIPDWGAVKSQVTWGNLTGKPDVIAVGATQEEARTAIGAGTSNLAIGTTSTTAAAGNHTHTEYASTTHNHTVSNITDISDVGKSVIMAPTMAAAREAIGATSVETVENQNTTQPNIMFWTGTQAEYDLITVPNPDTLYFIKS